jgi:ribose transport system substrate-binding protein
VKKRRYFYAFLAFIVVSLGTGGFLLSQNKGKRENTASPLRITMILPHSDYGYWSIVGNGVMSAGKDLGVDVKVEIPQLNYNVDQMASLIEKNTAAKVDAIIVQGIEDDCYLSALKKAEEKGIQIIFVDTDIENFPNRLYIGTDNYSAGYLMGEKTAEATGQKANIIIMSGAEGYPNLEQRYKGFKDAIKSYSDMKILDLKYDYYDALQFSDSYYEAKKTYPEADTLVCIEGTAAQTLGRRNNNLKEIYDHILAFDLNNEAVNAMKEGILHGVIVQQQEYMGYLAVEQAKQKAEQGYYDADVIFTDIYFMTLMDLDRENGYGKK